jgi:hypothetical protein
MVRQGVRGLISSCRPNVISDIWVRQESRRASAPTFWTNLGSAAPLYEVIATSRSGGIGSVPPCIVATLMQRY